MTTHVERQTRRKVAVESLSLVAAMGSAVFFSGLFIANWSLRRNLLVTVLTAVVLVLYCIWHRSRYPANIAPPTAETADADDDDDDAVSQWEWYWVLALGIGIIGVVIVGLLRGFFLALLVIVGFSFGYSETSSARDVVYACLAMLGFSAAVEFAVVLPLCKLWNLDAMADPEPRSTYCPTPTERP
jgi:fatty acid desaturase